MSHTIVRPDMPAEAAVAAGSELSVCVFAHNEAPRIRRCLQSVADALEGQPATTVTVVANACSDDTVGEASRFAAPHLTVKVLHLEIGDKSNAWNHFTYEVARPTQPVLFVDGDVWIGRGSVRALLTSLRRDTRAHIVAAVPSSGRNVDAYRNQQRANHSLWGNCYLASATFLDGIRERGLRLPVGYIGEDGLLETMAKTDYLSVPWQVHDEAIALEEQAEFFFDSMQAADVRKYVRRRIRYSLRAWQRTLLYRRLRERGSAALPTSVETLYDEAVLSLRPPLSTNWVFDYLALREMRRDMARSPQASVRQDLP